MKLLSNDEYILDITTDLEYKKKDYFLLLKRTVWIHPLRLDNELYIDVTFFQVRITCTVAIDFWKIINNHFV